MTTPTKYTPETLTPGALADELLSGRFYQRAGKYHGYGFTKSFLRRKKVVPTHCALGVIDVLLNDNHDNDLRLKGACPEWLDGQRVTGATGGFQLLIGFTLRQAVYTLNDTDFTNSLGDPLLSVRRARQWREDDNLIAFLRALQATMDAEEAARNAEIEASLQAMIESAPGPVVEPELVVEPEPVEPEKILVS